MSDLSVVIVNYNTKEMIRHCLSTLFANDSASCAEVIVVDNNSRDGSVEMIREDFPQVRVFPQEENLGFGAANNIGVAAARSRYIMLLNSDACPLGETGAALVRYLEDHPEVSCVGPLILLPDGRPQPRVFGNQPSLWRVAMQSLSVGALFTHLACLEGTDGGTRRGPEEIVGWISGVCMVMRRDDFLNVGGFDARIFMYCEDVELCGRLSDQIGPVVRLDCYPVRHYGGASSPTMAAQLQSAVWVQRNLLEIVRARSGVGGAFTARLLMSAGLMLRLGGGALMVPRRGVRANLLLRSSLVRMIDLVGHGS